MAEGLARAGAKVAVVYHTHRNAAESRVDAMRALGAEAMAVAADVQRREEIEKVRDAIVAQWGPVDILVNATGVNSTTPIFDISEDEWESILSTNLKSVFLACQIFGRVMIERGGGGSIINVSSAAARIPVSKAFTYSISKAGIDNLTRFLAREYFMESSSRDRPRFGASAKPLGLPVLSKRHPAGHMAPGRSGAGRATRSTERVDAPARAVQGRHPHPVESVDTPRNRPHWRPADVADGFRLRQPSGQRRRHLCRPDRGSATIGGHA